MVREQLVIKLQHRIKSLEAKLVNKEMYKTNKHFNYDLSKFEKLEKEVEIQKCYIANGNIYG